ADVLQFSLVIGGTSVMLVRQKGPWLLLLGGIMINVVGDTSHAFSDSLGRAGLVLAWIAWPASTFVMTIAMWIPPKPAPLLAARRSNSYLIPGLSAACALAILVVGSRQTLTEVAIWLATLTLALVGLSLLRSVRAMRSLSQQRRDQSLTDEL